MKKFAWLERLMTRLKRKKGEDVRITDDSENTAFSELPDIPEELSPPEVDSAASPRSSLKEIFQSDKAVSVQKLTREIKKDQYVRRRFKQS